MKRLIILFLLITTPLFAQHRALRIDSLEINDKNVTGFFNDVMSPYSDSTLFLDSLLVTDEVVSISGAANRTGADSSIFLCVDDGNGKLYVKATDGDSIVLYVSSSTGYLKSNNPLLIQGSGGSVNIFTVDGNKTSGNLLRVLNDNDGTPADSGFVIDATADVGIGTSTPKSGSLTLGDKGTQRDLLVTMEKTSLSTATDSCVQVWVDDGNGKIYLIAGDADSLVLTCDNDSAKIISNNTISMKTDVTIWGTVSAQTVTDRTEYIGEEEAVKLLKKVNLSTVDKFENEDDVFVLPYELRNKQYRSLSNCVSLLLAVAKSQQAEIEDLKKQIKKVKR